MEFQSSQGHSCSQRQVKIFGLKLLNEEFKKDNFRWGTGIKGKHGGYLTFHDRFNPGNHKAKNKLSVTKIIGKLVKRKWENCLTLDRKSWGNRRNMTVRFYNFYSDGRSAMIMQEI